MVQKPAGGRTHHDRVRAGSDGKARGGDLLPEVVRVGLQRVAQLVRGQEHVKHLRGRTRAQCVHARTMP